MFGNEAYLATGVVSHVSTALSLVAAVVIGLVTVVRSRRNERIQYTITLLQLKFSNLGIFRAHEYINNLIADGNESFLPENVRDSERDELVRDIDRLLSYFELISIAYLRSDIDREVIRQQIKSGMYKSYDICYEYIERRRQTTQRPLLYDNLRKVSDLFRPEGMSRPDGNQPIYQEPKRSAFQSILSRNN